MKVQKKVERNVHGFLGNNFVSDGVSYVTSRGARVATKGVGYVVSGAAFNDAKDAAIGVYNFITTW